MEIGEERSWIRLHCSVQAFAAKFDKWPARVRMHPKTLWEIKYLVLVPASFAELQEKIKIIEDERLGMQDVVSEDDEGHSSTAQEGYTQRKSNLNFASWFEPKSLS